MIGADSTFLIDLLKGREHEFKRYAEEDICTSEIVVYEVLQGVYAAKYFNQDMLKKFEGLLDALLYIFPVDRKASVIAAKIGARLINSGNMIGHSDVLIAGSLLANGCTRILTRNAKDFGKIKELEVLPY